MQATFEHKPDFRFRDFVIEKTVELTAERFADMLRHPIANYEPYPEEDVSEPTKPEPHRQALRDLIQTPLEDIHLLHAEVEIEPATIVELSGSTLTEAGKQEWADVLNAKVCRIYQGSYGLQAELKGVKPSRLQSFSTMLAGYCSEENYKKWVAQPEESTVQPPEMKL